MYRQHENFVAFYKMKTNFNQNTVNDSFLNTYLYANKRAIETDV